MLSYHDTCEIKSEYLYDDVRSSEHISELGEILAYVYCNVRGVFVFEIMIMMCNLNYHI